MPTKQKPDERIDKRKVTSRQIVLLGDGTTAEVKIEDYLRPDILDAYVASQQAKGYAVEVGDEPDAGPGGYDGQTHVPADLDHPLAGQTFPATES